MFMWKDFLRVDSTLSASPFLRTPLSTKMQVRLLPMALCTRRAATAESTPPLMPQTTLASPTFSRLGGIVGSRNHLIFPASLSHVLTHTQTGPLPRPEKNAACPLTLRSEAPYSLFFDRSTLPPRSL